MIARLSFRPHENLGCPSCLTIHFLYFSKWEVTDAEGLLLGCLSFLFQSLTSLIQYNLILIYDSAKTLFPAKVTL